MRQPRLRARSFPSIAALSEDARAWLHEQFKKRPRVTNADIGGDLHEKFGESLPRENLRRYRVWWESAERPMVTAYEQAEQMVEALKEKPAEDIVELVTQLLTAQALTAAGQLEETAKPEDIVGLHVFNQKIEAEKRKIRLQERKLALQEAASKVDDVGKKTGLTKDTIEKIKREILGVAA